MDRSDSLTLVLSPDDNYYSRGNDKWNAELVDLDRAIRAGMPESVAASEGVKGDLSAAQVVVQILTSGAILPLFGIIKSWIQVHPGRRQLDLSWTQDGKENRLVVDATNIDSDVLKATLLEAMKQRK